MEDSRKPGPFPATDLVAEVIGVRDEEAGRPGDDSPRIAIVWDPAVVSPTEYAELVTAIGDVVRAAGGLGVVRARADDYGAKIGEGVLS